MKTKTKRNCDDVNFGELQALKEALKLVEWQLEVSGETPSNRALHRAITAMVHVMEEIVAP